MTTLALYSLVPESALLQQCPAQLRKRFAVALAAMHSHDGQQLSWQQIAQQAAISPFHFHRQFSQLFAEPPARYLARQRLNAAVLNLLDYPHKSVTAIAHDCGYLSSQALAKAMQRQLGMTAKQLRALAQRATLTQLTALLEKLGQPGSNQPVEQQLAGQIIAKPEWLPQRYLRGKVATDFAWQRQLDKAPALLQRMATLTPVAEAANALDSMTVIAGQLSSAAEAGAYTINAGCYLTAQVRLTSALAYLAAWDRLYSQVQQQGFIAEQSGYFIEQLLNYDADSITLLLQLPVQPVGVN
ncbi:MAG: helix-turn-helix transcriptional regulator [Gammaproteobacteria bacterium]|nr:helix-turn-helix transcriptional regulator [Gammaproteobacteria bacterium]MBU1555888.1 helix-turn-helix transcriptional regulator [Gammaproteobacteria bacterium]MBU2072563.1 helix-turn-helix transcriptional regulator [Gammaproteobacteria bacterium]MBU2184093.1 helix-turn-helix transcriptional regulator [Gammaproteobacteria bacterium]MBU2206821.1 helix-turn-helix transcriptional regulator [Gammaproteobacteria bacterium]